MEGEKDMKAKCTVVLLATFLLGCAPIVRLPESLPSTGSNTAQASGGRRSGPNREATEALAPSAAANPGKILLIAAGALSLLIVIIAIDS